MLRITVAQEIDGPTRIRVEGRITGENMGELRSVCDGRLGGGVSLVLDVSELGYCDAQAAALLDSLGTSGAAVVGANGFVAELLGRASSKTEPRRRVSRGAEAARDHAPRRRAAGARAQVRSDARVAAQRATQAESDGRVAVPPATTEPVHAGEQALVAALRAGDDAAFETLVRRYGARLLAVARRVLGNEEDARDALQESFLSAFRAIGSFTGDALLSTWLHRVVVNACLMRLRSRRRRREESLDDLLPGFADDGHFLEAPSSWRSDELLERDDTRAAVRRCIERLPARHREVLVLRDIEELDTAEVADALGITPNAVKVRLHRARQALRTLIEREIVEPAPAEERMGERARG